MLHDLSDAPFWSQRIEVNMSLIDVVAVHGAIVLACKHPRMGPNAKRLLTDIAGNIAENLIALHALEPQDILDMDLEDATI